MSQPTRSYNTGKNTCTLHFRHDVTYEQIERILIDKELTNVAKIVYFCGSSPNRDTGYKADFVISTERMNIEKLMEVFGELLFGNIVRVEMTYVDSLKIDWMDFISNAHTLFGKKVELKSFEPTEVVFAYKASDVQKFLEYVKSSIKQDAKVSFRMQGE